MSQRGFVGDGLKIGQVGKNFSRFLQNFNDFFKYLSRFFSRLFQILRNAFFRFFLDFF